MRIKASSEWHQSSALRHLTLRVGLKTNPALQVDQIRKISTVSTAWNPLDKLAALSSHWHLPSKLAEAEYLLVRKVANMYLGRGEQTINRLKATFQCTQSSCTENGDVHLLQNSGAVWEP